MERTAPHVTRWPAEILGFGDRDMPDAAHGVSACVAAVDAGTYGLHRPQTPIPPILQADHRDPARPESPEHNDQTRTACLRAHRLNVTGLGNG